MTVSPAANQTDELGPDPELAHPYLHPGTAVPGGQFSRSEYICYPVTTPQLGNVCCCVGWDVES